MVYSWSVGSRHIHESPVRYNHSDSKRRLSRYDPKSYYAIASATIGISELAWTFRQHSALGAAITNVVQSTVCADADGPA